MTKAETFCNMNNTGKAFIRDDWSIRWVTSKRHLIDIPTCGDRTTSQFEDVAFVQESSHSLASRDWTTSRFKEVVFVTGSSHILLADQMSCVRKAIN